jgi:hypothetical protein
MSSRNGDREAARKEQARMRREQSASERGLADAQQGTIDMENLGNEDLIAALTNPDIERDDGQFADLEGHLSAEFGRHLALGNISEEDHERKTKRDRGHARLAKMEFPRAGRIGSKCRGNIRDIMTADEEPANPTLTDDAARQIDAAFEQREQQRSLAKGGLLVKNLLQAIVETRSKTDSDDERSRGGIMSRLFG